MAYCADLSCPVGPESTALVGTGVHAVLLAFRDPNKANPALYEEYINRLNALPKRIVPCPVCGEERPFSLCCRRYGLDVVRCDSCGHVYVNPQLDPSAVRIIYDLSYWNRLQPAIGSPTMEERIEFDYWNALAKLHRDILPFKQKGRFLDVGCSNGALVKRAQELGFEAVGLEVSPDVASVGRRRFNVEVRVGILSEMVWPDCYFDCITMYDVLEHLFEPVRDLEICFRLLKKGGILIVETVNTDSLAFLEQGCDWHYIMPIEHVHYFSEWNLVRTLERIGFEVLESKCPHEDNVVVVSRHP